MIAGHSSQPMLHSLTSRATPAKGSSGVKEDDDDGYHDDSSADEEMTPEVEDLKVEKAESEDEVEAEEATVNRDDDVVKEPPPKRRCVVSTSSSPSAPAVGSQLPASQGSQSQS